MSDIAIIDDSELNTADEEQLVTMMVDNQLFGIPILVVQDIVEPVQITPVPLAPSAIAGVLNLRGRIVTVIDLRECLGAKPQEQEYKQMSVTVEYKGDLYTLLVDSIGDVRSLPRKNFDKPPATLDENLKRVCSGIFRLEGNLLVVLDVDRILDEETILKTPRRTRRRRDFSAAANKNKKKADVKTADVADEVETEAATEEKKPVKTTLICQGERDALGNREEVESFRLSAKIGYNWAPDGDHSLKPRKKSGHSEDENLEAACHAIIHFMSQGRN